MHTESNTVQSISSPAAPTAIGPYSQATTVGGLVFVSGQLPIDVATGQFPSDDIADQTEQAITNIAAVLTAVDLSLHDVVKTTVLLADLADFERVNAVYSRHFDGPVLPARAAYQVSRLPKDARIEIEAIAVRPTQ
nr:RidA family protein [Rhodococcus sp. (in: high G+C Gram-positive bacteria)]